MELQALGALAQFAVASGGVTETFKLRPAESIEMAGILEATRSEAETFA